MKCSAVMRIAAVVVSVMSLCAAPQSYADIRNDRAHRDQSIHWPKANDSSVAPVFTHNELLVHASCHRVWEQFTDVTKWPAWFVLTKDVSVQSQNPKVQLGTVLHLKIFGTPITSRIDEFVPDSRLNWIPKGDDEPVPSHYHAWHLISEPAGCRVVTEETGIGPNDHDSPEVKSAFIHRAHDLWLASLRWVSEQ